MKALLSALTVGVCAVACTDNSGQTKPLSQEIVESRGLVDFYCGNSHKDSLATSGWDYVSGLVANAVLKAYELYPEKSEYIDAVRDYANYSTSEDGNEIFKRPKNVTALGESNVDDLAAGKIYFPLIKDALSKGDTALANRYNNALTLIITKLARDHQRISNDLEGTGGFWHKKRYPNQMWLDGLYMAPALYGEWLYNNADRITRDSLYSAWSDVARQFIILHEHTYNPDVQLCYHAWSATPDEENSFWARKEAPYKGCSPEFWARSMGWYAGALVDILEWMPKDHTDYATLLENFQTICAGLLRWQDKTSGTWYQLLQYDANVAADGKGDIVDGETFNVGTQSNYLESSATGMFAYVFYKGARLGLLDSTTYKQAADKAYDGMQKHFINHEGGVLNITNICASAGLGPAKDHSRTGTINYYLNGKDTRITQNEGKAIGTFILAAVEHERVADKQ